MRPSRDKFKSFSRKAGDTDAGEKEGDSCASWKTLVSIENASELEMLPASIISP
jgi:hypothetical protein